MVYSIHSTKSEKLLRTELIISHVLRVGVLVCASVIGLGIALTWTNGAALQRFSKQILPDLISGHPVAEAEIPRSMMEFGASLAAFDSNTIIAFGLLLLIALPIVRVALTVFLFLFERDYVYLTITLFVLTVLLSGMILGKAL